MRYLAAFFASAALAVPALLATAFALAPAPIPAEYWVRQAMVIKADIARRHRGERKAFVVGGSSALFAIDTSQLAREFRVPFVNLATHVNLPLEVQLGEAATAAERGDAVILALEPGYYCPPAQNAWYFRNAIAWRPEAWHAMPVVERAAGFWKAGPWFLAELAIARFTRAVAPDAIRDRLEALDDAATLRRFAAAKPPAAFAYTIEGLDPLGNIVRTEGTHRLRQEGWSPATPFALCGSARAALGEFAQRERRGGVEVRFAYIPFMADPGADAARVASAAHEFERDLAAIAPLLEPRAAVTFDRRDFFDTGLHLNATGREKRTASLARALHSDAALLAPARP